jgi:protein PhnA
MYGDFLNSSEMSINCPSCDSDLTYADQDQQICTQCAHEWNPQESQSAAVVLDANGNQLQDGDTVTVIKDLPVKGSSKPIKSGTKVKNIRLVDGHDDHNIDCKIDGFGAMALKSQFVKKI